MRAMVRRVVCAFALSVLLGASATTALAADLSVDDRALAKRGSWSKVKQSKALSGTLLKSRRSKASLTAKVDAVAGGSVTFQVGKGRGTAKITVGGKRVRTVKTSSTKTKFKTLSFKGAGTVKITVTKQGRGVYVDAVTLTGLGPASDGTAPGGGSGPGGTPPGSGPGGAPGGTTPGSPGPGAGLPPVNLGPLTQLDTTAAGEGANGDDVRAAAVSPNGLYVAFWSPATNLVAGVADGAEHLYLKTLATGAIRVLDTSQGGALAQDFSSGNGSRALAWRPDSKELLFSSSATNLGPDVSSGTAPFLYAKDITDNSVGWIADRSSIDAAWSPDGTKIAYGSYGDYCRPADSPCTNTAISDTKLYVVDVNSWRRIPVSATSSGAQPQPNSGPNDSLHPVWSPDSTKVAFESDSPQLVPGDTNVAGDVFIKDINTLAISRVSMTPSGAQANNESEWPAFSPNGAYIAFNSTATNLAPGDNNSGADVFVKDLASGAITVVSATPAGEFKLFRHRLPKWSPDGARIAFETSSVDLVPGYVDANQRDDIAVRTLATGAIQLISATANGTLGTGDSTVWDVRGNSGGWLPDGSGLMFISRATNFSNDGNAFSQSLFLKRGL